MSAIFISHSSQDNSTVEPFTQRLQAQGHRSLFLDFDPEVGIPAGRKWEQELYRKLSECRALIVLCSQHSMRSEWCFAEIVSAKSLGKPIFPIKIDDCNIIGLLTDFQVIDLTAGNREEVYQRLWKGLKIAGLDPANLFDWDSSRPPYPGLLAFEEKDAAIFFGREQAINRGLSELNQLRIFGGAKFLLVLGASGCGKSSLVKAGLLARLKRDKRAWLVPPAMRRGMNPFDASIEALSDCFIGAGGDAENWGKLHQEFRHSVSFNSINSEKLLAIGSQFRTLPNCETATILISIDQLEEFLNSGVSDIALSMQFLHLLKAVLSVQDSPFLALGTLRSDFLGSFQELDIFGDGDYQTMSVGQMDARGILDVIEGPAKLSGLKLEEGLAQHMLQDTKTDNALPLLAFALRQLWEQWGHSGQFALEDYRNPDKLGGLEGSVARVANAVLDSYSSPGNPARPDIECKLRTAFLKLVRINDDGQLVRQAVPWRDISGDIHPLLERFVDARLLVSSRSESTAGSNFCNHLEVAHEALFRTWPLLVSWLRDDRQFLLLKRRLNQDAVSWQDSDRAEERLLRGAALEQAVGWLQQRPADLTPLEREFIESGVAVRDRLKQVELARRNRELEQERKARKAAQRSLRIGLGALALVSVLGLVSGIQWIRSERQLIAATSRSSQLLSSTGQQFDALLEGLSAAQRLRRLRWTDGDSYLVHLVWLALNESIFGIHEFNRLEEHSGKVYAVRFSPDGQLLASAGADGTIRLWAPEGALVQTLEHHRDRVYDLSFSPDGSTLATASADATIALWNTDGTLRQILREGRSDMFSVAFSHDGQLLASGSADGLIKLWRADGALLDTIAGHGDVVNDVSFSSDGQFLASASADRTIKLWNRDGTLAQTIDSYRQPVLSVEFSPDNQLIAATSNDGTVTFWNPRGEMLNRIFEGGVTQDVAFNSNGQLFATAGGDSTVKLWMLDGTLVDIYEGHSDGVLGVSFSPNGQTLASSSADGSIKLWNRQSLLASSLYGHTDSAYSVVFSPDGEIVASAGADNTVRLWSRAGIVQNVLRGHTDLIHGVAFSPDGQIVLSASWDGTVSVWDLEGTQLTAIEGHSGRVYAATFSPNGDTIATASGDGTIKLWSPAGQLLKTLRGHTDVVHAVEFSPDGQLLVSGSHDKTVRLWTLDGRLLRTFRGHTNWVHSVSFSADGQTIASAGHDRTIRLWNRQGELLDTLAGHTRRVLDVAFSPDGQMIASSSLDRTVKLWSLNGGLIYNLRGHNDMIHGVSFSPDGQTLATASADNTIHLWDVSNLSDIDVLIAQSCQWMEGYVANSSEADSRNMAICDRP